MEQDDTRGSKSKASDEQKKAMRALLKSLRAKAHFRYPINEPSATYQALNAAFEDIFGPDKPNSAQARWVRRLRRLGLIG
jgi:hypothetical protein